MSGQPDVRPWPRWVRNVVRSVLALFGGGMGSFSDVVLQDARGALPVQARPHGLRDVLFEEARRELA